MGQTLNHGVYLPAEGERNCYSGLASNWNLLDTAIGDIAGKASATHSHGNISNDGKVGTTANKPLITGTGGVVQAGSFGNQANTFCEGNDSRLSDARTPVAHTHGKADVTDLLNSNFIPSANNSYDLGSSSYQWNNLYAKNYFYNGTAWGLDKANVWSAIQTISYAGSNVAIALKHQETDIVASPTRNNWHYINFYDKNSVALGGFNYTKRTNGNSRVYLNLRTKNTNNDIVEKNVFFETNQEGTDWNLYPASNADINLGTSTNKWKTLNGVNPGSLSFPSEGTAENTDWFNVAGSILPTGGNVTDLTGGSNFFTPSKDGWLCLVVKDCSYISVWDGSSRMGQSLYAPDTTKNQQIILPVLANHSLEIRVIGSSWHSARLFMPKGNV